MMTRSCVVGVHSRAVRLLIAPEVAAQEFRATVKSQVANSSPNNANQRGNNIACVPPAKPVQEFKIAPNSYDAQYGRTAGGVVNVSLKSGTNSFHGVRSEFYRRKWLDANSFRTSAGAVQCRTHIQPTEFSGTARGREERP